jgi:hypothetical protein
VNYEEIKEILQLIIFGEASITSKNEKKVIAGVYLNELSYPVGIFDKNEGDNGIPDPYGVAKNFGAWNNPNISLKSQFDLAVMIECGMIANEYVERFKSGERGFFDNVVFYATKQRLKQLGRYGQEPQDIFTKYYPITEVYFPEYFYHRFFRIVDTEEVKK